ncbi:hypothetical protein FHW72_001425 [Ochrobactrum sp. RC6B]|nr:MULTISPECIES: hypothetical protein [Brucella/Ochrobactrum group]MBB3216354.1 hypothetical protein [Ochrobactrum sp. RC6B]
MVFQLGSIAHFPAMSETGGPPEVSASRLPILPCAVIFDDADRTQAPLPQGQIEELTQNCKFSGDFQPSIRRSGPVNPIEVGFWPPTRLNIPRTCTEQYPRRMARSSRDSGQNYRQFLQYGTFQVANWKNVAFTGLLL